MGNFIYLYDWNTLKNYGLLCWDGVSSVFLLTDHMEIYLSSDDIICCYCWDKSIYNKLKAMGYCFGEKHPDFGPVVFKSDISNLPYISSIGQLKSLPSASVLEDRVHALGHEIFQL